MKTLPDAIFKNICPVSYIAEVSARRQSVLAEESEVSKHDGNHLAADRGIKTVPMVFNSDNINHRNRASKTVIVATLSNSRNSAGLGWAVRGGNNQMSFTDFLNTTHRLPLGPCLGPSLGRLGAERCHWM